MRWKDYETWFKGAIIGLLIALLISLGIGGNIPVLSLLSIPGVYSCHVLTQCTGDVCNSCLVVGFMLNLFYGFVIGAIIGSLVQICYNKKNKRRKK